MLFQLRATRSGKPRDVDATVWEHRYFNTTGRVNAWQLTHVQLIRCASSLGANTPQKTRHSKGPVLAVVAHGFVDVELVELPRQQRPRVQDHRLWRIGAVAGSDPVGLLVEAVHERDPLAKPTLELL